MDDDGNDGKDDVDLRSSFSHTLSLPPSLQAHHCPLPPPLPQSPGVSSCLHGPILASHCLEKQVGSLGWAFPARVLVGRSVGVGWWSGPEMANSGSGNTFMLILFSFGRKNKVLPFSQVFSLGKKQKQNPHSQGHWPQARPHKRKEHRTTPRRPSSC